MKGGGGKSKGSGFERKVCKRLSRWVSGGSREDLYWRSAMSGGRATVQAAKGIKNTTQVGDISSIDPAGNCLTDWFSVECKFYRDLDLVNSFLLGRGRLMRFWRQCCRDAERAGKTPLLIVKQNRLPELVVTTLEGSERLGVDPILGLNGRHWNQVVVVFFSTVLSKECQL